MDSLDTLRQADEDPRRRQAEPAEALRERQQRLRFALAAAGAGLWDWDIAANVFYWTDELYPLFGLDPAAEQAGFESWRRAVHPDDREGAEARIRAAVAARTPFASEYRVVLSSGEIRWISSLGSTTYGGDGAPLRMSGICIDVTDHKRAEATSRETLGRLDWVLDVTGVGLWLNELPLGTLNWDARTRELFFVEPGEAPSIELFWSRLHPDDREPTRLAVEAAIRDHALYAVDHRALHPVTGEVRWIRSVGHAAYRADGAPVRFDGINFDITGRKRAEDELRTQRLLLETVINHMPAAVTLIRGRDLRLQIVNATYQAIAPGKTMVGRTLDELWPETGQDFSAICRRVLETGEPHLAVDEPNMIRRQPGGPAEQAYFSWSMHRVLLPGDDGWGILNTAWETTARVEVEKALRTSQEDLMRAEAVAQLGWWRLDTRRNVLTWSDQNHRLFGVPKGTPLTYQTFLACVHPDDRAYVDAEWTAGLAGRPYDVEHRVIVDGQVRWLRERAYLEFDDAGGLLGGFGISQDVTERKLAEQALRRAEEERKVAAAIRAERERFFNVLDTLPAMICLLTPDYHVAFANLRFREEFGDSNGRHCYEYCFGRTAPCEFCQTYDVLKTGQPRHWEITTPKGTVIDVHDLPFTDADGTPMILEMDVDITERRRIESELQLAHADLAARAAQLRALAGELTLSEQRERRRLARVLHDHVQGLLVAAKFRTAIAARTDDDGAPKEMGEIEHLLDESIAALRVLTAELSPPILHEAGLVAGLTWLSRWMADRHGLRVVLSVKGEMPAPPEDLRVVLFESVRELLFNVVKHANVASADVTVDCGSDRTVRITVSDAGAGFDASARGPGGQSGGGFGLFGIRERLALMGGRLDVVSAPGAGSRLTLTAPVPCAAAVAGPGHAAPAADAAPDATAPAARARRRAAPARRRKAGDVIGVLIADDHALVREGLTRLLRRETDIRIVGEAADGVEAVAMARELRPDVVLMDVSMPALDGIEATRRIRAAFPDVGVIGLSMFEDEVHAAAMREAGAAAYLSKSGPSRTLVSAIRRVFRRPARARRTQAPSTGRRRKAP